MATKADVERELRALRLEHEGFKQRVSTVTKEKMEQYGISLCNDGLRDWAEELGVKAPIAQEAYVITLSIHVECSEDDIDAIADDLAGLVDGPKASAAIHDRGEFQYTDVDYDRE